MARRPRLALSAYRALIRKKATLPPTDRSARPRGELIWLHPDDEKSATALIDLGRTIAQDRKEASLLITAPGTTPEDGELMDSLPKDSDRAVSAFLDHWEPDLCLWAQPSLPPNLLTTAAARGIRIALLNARFEHLTTPAPRWLGDLTEVAIDAFARIFPADDASEARFVDAGIPSDRLAQHGSLAISQTPPGCALGDFEAMAELLAARPIWLAAHVAADEIEDVLDAHQRATRTAHRLLLIVVPDQENDASRIVQATREHGLRLCKWDDGDEPDEHTQVLLASETTSLGLWYRVAPLAFLGCSLHPGHGGQSPFAAAALGSAILHGPLVNQHADGYEGLARHGAVRRVEDARDLGRAVAQLLSPDKAAVMAHAAWQVTSEGASLNDAVVEWSHDALDLKGAV